MNLILDLDGVVAEGTHIEAPDDPKAYLDLGLYDHDVAELWNYWTREHHVTLITSRHHDDALGLIQIWLRQHFLRLPNSIITRCVPKQKGAVAKALAADLFVDDSVEAVVGALAVNVPRVALMHNEAWVQNRDSTVSARRLRSWQELRKVVDG